MDTKFGEEKCKEMHRNAKKLVVKTAFVFIPTGKSTSGLYYAPTLML